MNDLLPELNKKEAGPQERRVLYEVILIPEEGLPVGMQFSGKKNKWVL